LLLYSSKPSLGVFQLAGHLISYTIDSAPSSFSGAVAGERNSYINYIFPRQLGTIKQQASFSGAVAGEEVEYFCEGSFSHTHPLLCFKFCFTLFYLHRYISKTQKN
jgi:hypothetical protein